MKLQLGERDHNKEISKCEERGDRGGEVGNKPRAGGEARVEIGQGGEEHIPERRLGMDDMVEGGIPYQAQSMDMPRRRNTKYASNEKGRVATPRPLSELERLRGS